MTTPRQSAEARRQLFAAEYLKDLNATRAFVTVYGRKKNAKVEGALATRLLQDARTQVLIKAGQAKRLASTELSATRILEELRRLALSDTRSLFDAHGNLRPIHMMTAEEAACIASLEVIKKNAEAGDGVIDVVHKVKLWDKTRALEMLAKHFALLTEVVKIDASDALVARLQSARRRVDKP